MNKKGFTLVELLAVIMIIAIIAAFALPRVLNQFSNNTGELEKKEKELLLNSARTYIEENKGEYIGADNVKTPFCLTIDQLVNSNNLNAGFAKDTLGNDYNSNYSIQVIHNKETNKDVYSYLLCESSGCASNCN